jgi:MSHA pilin protein MshA
LVTSRRGFTLIELVIVIAIIGILASLAYPKFIDISVAAKISSTKGALGALRAMVTIKYAEECRLNPSTCNDGVVNIFVEDNTDELVNKLNGKPDYCEIASVPGGLETGAEPAYSAPNCADYGFWLVGVAGPSLNKVGAWSDGTIDTSTW